MSTTAATWFGVAARLGPAPDIHYRVYPNLALPAHPPRPLSSKDLLWPLDWERSKGRLERALRTVARRAANLARRRAVIGVMLAPRTRPATVLASVILTAVVGCAGPDAPSAAATTTLTTTAAEPTMFPNVTDPPVPSVAAPAQGPLCTIEQLAITAARGDDPGGGALYGVIQFTNRGTVCYLRGWPRLLGVDHSKRQLFAAGRFTGGDQVPTQNYDHAQTVRLLPGRAASAVTYSVYSSPQPGAFQCPRYDHLEVGLPAGGATKPYGDPTLMSGLWLCNLSVGAINAGVYQLPHTG